MKNFKRSVVAALILGGALGVAGMAQASIVVTISETGSNLTLSYGAGTLDTTGLNQGAHYSGCDNLFTGVGSLIGGGAAGACTGFNNGITVTKSAGWTLTGGQTAWSSTLGTSGLIAAENYFGTGSSIFIGDDPGAAISGINTIGAMTGMVNGMSFASAGLTAGQYIDFSWGSDSLRFTTGGTDVPEPATLSLFGLTLAGLLLSRRRRS